MATAKEKSVFETLNGINVNEHVEKKKTGEKNPDGTDKTLSYLSWAWAWGQVKQKYPDANYEVKHWDGKPYLNDDQLGIMVETSVTINGETITMWLPVMNGNNKAMKVTAYSYKTKYGDKAVEAATMFDINKAIMRCLAKNIAMFGLGLYIYAGEDIPEEERVAQRSARNATESKAVAEIRGAETIEAVSAIYKGYQKTNPDICRKGGALYTAAIERANELKQTA